mgnify:FL=1
MHVEVQVSVEVGGLEQALHRYLHHEEQLLLLLHLRVKLQKKEESMDFLQLPF